jgi:hypothetical protein
MDDLIHDDAIDPAWMEDEAEGVVRGGGNITHYGGKKILFLKHMHNMVL